MLASAAGMDATMPITPPVTAIVVSKRPQLVDRVVDIIRAQTHRPAQVVFVCHGSDFMPDQVAEKFLSAGIKCLVIPLEAEGTYLADGLNLAREHARTPLIAKIDDDDYYGPNYLKDACLAFTYTDATIVGKNSYFCYLEKTDQTLLRFPGRHYRNTSLVHGGTLVWREELIRHVRFPRMRQGTDSNFLKTVRSAGGRIVSIDPFNFVHVRYANTSQHTWQIDDATFAEKATHLSAGLPLAEIMI
jgi:hypothetical protein